MISRNTLKTLGMILGFIFVIIGIVTYFRSEGDSAGNVKAFVITTFGLLFCWLS